MQGLILAAIPVAGEMQFNDEKTIRTMNSLLSYPEPPLQG